MTDQVPVKDASSPPPEWDEPAGVVRPSAEEPSKPTLETPWAKPEEPPESAQGSGWYYCLFEDHPGVPRFSSKPLDVGRLFQDAKDAKVPTCPVDGEQNNIPAEGPDLPPEAILKLAERFTVG